MASLQIDENNMRAVALSQRALSQDLARPYYIGFFNHLRRSINRLDTMQTCSAPLSCFVSLHLTQVQFKRRSTGAIKELDRKSSNKPSAAPPIEEHLSCPFGPATPRNSSTHAQ